MHRSSGALSVPFMYILGINCYHNFASATLVDDERIIASVEEERLSRIKYDGNFPERAIRYCLDAAGIDLAEVEHVGFYYNPWLGLGGRALAFLREFPGSVGGLGPDYASEWFQILGVGRELKRRLASPGRKPRFRLHFVDHYIAHAASCYLVSPFEKAAILCIDGNGERSTTWLGFGDGDAVRRISEVAFPHSVGLFYATVTEFLGFRNNADEGKVMGLAAYGTPDRIDDFREITPIGPAGKFELDLSYFEFHRSTKDWYSPAFVKRFGPPRRPDDPIEPRHKNLAASLQLRTEELGLSIATHLYDQTKSENLTMAGGVALNSVMNGRIQRETPFENLFVQPAANDAGTSMGAALAVHTWVLGRPRRHTFETAYLGPGIRPESVEAAALAAGLPQRHCDDPLEEVARLLEEGKIIGWFQGRMEVGPRALGNRSILADPRRADMKDILNRKVKNREDFRPFAPVVLQERVGDFFIDIKSSPYMLQVAQVRPDRRADIPSVIHVDGSGRVQTLTREANPNFYGVIEAFGRRTGVPVVLNTSFNRRGQPIVHTAEEAVSTFVRSGMDHLYMDGRLFDRA